MARTDRRHDRRRPGARPAGRFIVAPARRRLVLRPANDNHPPLAVLVRRLTVVGLGAAAVVALLTSFWAG